MPIFTGAYARSLATQPSPQTAMSADHLLACHECDLLQWGRTAGPGVILRCRRCNAELYRSGRGSIDNALAFALGSIVLFMIANVFPMVGLSVNGDTVQTTLFGSARMLYLHGMWILALLVLATTILAPLLQMAAMLYLLVPLRLGRTPYRPEIAFRVMNWAKAWGMTEVLVLGMLVALVKLSHIASVVLGVALWSYGALMLLLAAAMAAFDSHQIWSRIGKYHGADSLSSVSVTLNGATASSCGLLVCNGCGTISKPPLSSLNAYCPVCRSRLHFRKLGSISRSWAFLIAASILYVPANVLPVMHTSSLFGAQQDTILSGIVYLWNSGSWILAVLVFIASIAVPILKILAIAFLVITGQRRSPWIPEKRARIYRLVEFVGRWSMLDIYVITMLAALVQFNALAAIRAGPAAVAFGAVVVLTMFAAMSFDPRLTWDGVEKGHGHGG